MSIHGIEQCSKHKSDRDYIKDLPDDVFMAKLYSLYHDPDFGHFNSGTRDEDEIERLKQKMRKVLPFPIETKDDVNNVVVAISSRIITGFDHRPGVDF